MRIRQKKRLFQDNAIQGIEKKMMISDSSDDAEPKPDVKDEVGRIVKYDTMQRCIRKRPSVVKLRELNDTIQKFLEISAALYSDKNKGNKVVAPKGNMNHKFKKETRLEPLKLPIHIKEAIVNRLGGNNITWINKKNIELSDISATQCRLYLPNELPQVLTQAEKNYLQVPGNPRNTLDVLVVDHEGLEWIIPLKYWPKVDKYVFGKKWLELVKLYKIRASVNDVVEIWSFRRLYEEHDDVGQLCFALNFPNLKKSRSAYSDGASTSGGVNNAPGTGLDGGADVSGTNTNSIGDGASDTDMNGDASGDGIGSKDVTMT